MYTYIHTYIYNIHMQHTHSGCSGLGRQQAPRPPSTASAQHPVSRRPRGPPCSAHTRHRQRASTRVSGRYMPATYAPPARRPNQARLPRSRAAVLAPKCSAKRPVAPRTHSAPPPPMSLPCTTPSADAKVPGRASGRPHANHAASRARPLRGPATRARGRISPHPPPPPPSAKLREAGSRGGPPPPAGLPPPVPSRPGGTPLTRERARRRRRRRARRRLHVFACSTRHDDGGGARPTPTPRRPHAT